MNPGCAKCRWHHSGPRRLGSGLRVWYDECTKVGSVKKLKNPITGPYTTEVHLDPYKDNKELTCKHWEVKDGTSDV